MLDLTRLWEAHINQRLRPDAIVWPTSTRPDGHPHRNPAVMSHRKVTKHVLDAEFGRRAQGHPVVLFSYSRGLLRRFMAVSCGAQVTGGSRRPEKRRMHTHVDNGQFEEFNAYE
jgi:hypothetical protein